MMPLQKRVGKRAGAPCGMIFTMSTPATAAAPPSVTKSIPEILAVAVAQEEEEEEMAQKKIATPDLLLPVEDAYQLLDAYFRGQHLDRLVRHQIESYNYFITHQIQRTISMFNPVTIRSENDYVAEHGQYYLEIHVRFENFKMYPPQIHENNGATKIMLPQEAKLRNFTYASVMTVDVHIEYVVRNTDAMDVPHVIERVLPKVNIGKMPIMLKSCVCVLTQNHHIEPAFTGECPFDCGGYFIIKGSEKTVLGQERAAENKIYVFDGKGSTKWSWCAEIKSVPDYKCISPKQIEMMISSKNNGFGYGLWVCIPRLKAPIELFAVFKALGVASDKAMCEYILLDLDDPTQSAVLLDKLQASVYDANAWATQEDALRYMSGYAAYTPIKMDSETGQRKKYEFTRDVLDHDLFPHCTTKAQKLYFLGYMALRLLQTSMGWVPKTDRDSYVNKRIELTGTLLNNLFRNYFNKLVKEMQKLTVREINQGSWRSTEDVENIINATNVDKIIKSTTIENGIARALSTGDFSIKQSNSSKVGVAQVLNRLTYVASLSHLRRINTPLEKSGELIEPRKLHSTTWGYLCLTGDAEVLLSDRVTTKKIKDMRDGDCVTTVNPKTLAEEPSPIYNFFGRMPEKLFEVTTMSGRVIKATPEHPFLVLCEDGACKWKKMEELTMMDRMIVRHVVKHIADDNTTTVILDETHVLPHFRMELKGFLHGPISTRHLKILARLMGAIKTGDGYFQERVENDTESFCALFFVGEESDVFQIVNDISALGLGQASIERNANQTWQVSKSGAFADLLYLLGGNACAVPDWLMHAELSIKREFLSGFQGDCGGSSFTKNDWAPSCWKIASNDYLDDTVKYMTQVMTLFADFGIKSSVKITPVPDEPAKSKVTIQFQQSCKNMVLYADTIQYVYCEEKRRASAPVIERLKTKMFQAPVIEDSISVPISSIRQVPPEMVYDFTTYSDNHSFIASSYVSSNCLAETPEGQSIGVVKNISFMTHITIPSHAASLYDCILPQVLRVDDAVACRDLHGKVKVIINGCWVGVTDTPHELYRDIKAKKMRGIINAYTSVVFDHELLEIRVCNDGGRLARPLLRVEQETRQLVLSPDVLGQVQRQELGWNDLLTDCRIPEAVVEYIDPEEQNFVLVAMRPSVQPTEHSPGITHAEIHPSTIFGVLASCIPFPEHNQAPRNTYQCAMAKQAIGVYATNYDQRMDKTAYVLTYPSRPLVDTRLMTMIQINKIPSGCQVHVAIMSHTGYNQEDSVLINQGSIDRGLFLTTIYHTEKDEDKNIIRDQLIRCKPDPVRTKGVKFGNYGKLNAQGFIPENTLVENRDVLIAKIVPIKENRNDPTKVVKYEDQSKIFRTTEETYVDKNFTGRNGDGYNFAKVRTRTLRKPVLGDKMASRAAQKGTVGNIIPECDMPFTKDGLRPDIIINPHCLAEDHEILTEMGFLSWHEVQSTMGTLDVCGYDAATGKIVYEKPTDFIFNESKEQGMVEFTNDDNVSLLVTPDHDMYAKKGFVGADKVYWSKAFIKCKAASLFSDVGLLGPDAVQFIGLTNGIDLGVTTVSNIKRVAYTGMTWCVTMPHGFIITRRAVRNRDNVLVKASRPVVTGQCIPSRMTIAQLKETLLGKVLIELGLYGDGTSFTELGIKSIAQELQKLGYESCGNELLYNGMTGEQLETSTFIGPVFYQRLKHMVNDKQHSRAIGPMVNLTRQPAEGRSRDGGFRVGEMERDVMLAHGMSRFCRERLYDSSDKYAVHVCNRCGMIAAFNDGNHRKSFAKDDFTVHLCYTCDNTTDFSRVEVPYAYKLLTQELQTINVCPRLITAPP